MEYVESAALGTMVSQITGKGADGLTAGGYAAIVKNITGKQPTVIRLPANRVSLVLTKEQVVQMRTWLDRQTTLGIKLLGKKPESLEIDLSPVVMPWLIKTMLPFAGACVALGWVAHMLIRGK
jgi:hypothetical protein